MFKKKPTVKPLAPVRSSDRRKLADNIISNLSIPVPEASSDSDSSSGVAALRSSLLPASTRTARFSTTHGPDLTPVHGTIYVGSPIASQDSRASWLSISLPKTLQYTTAPSASGDEFFPTIYTLWRMPGLLPVVRTHEPVIEKLLGGADLMIPGLVGPPWPEAKVGDIVAVEGKRKGVAMAVGILEVELKGVQSVGGERGRAVKILHWWGDEVWNYGSGEDVSIPDGIEIATESMEGLKVSDAAAATEEGSEAPDEKKDDENDGTEAIRDLTTEEIDDAFHKAALFGLSSQADRASDISFPLSSSAFMSDFVLPFLPPASSFPPFNLLQSAGPHPSLTLKKSSWKNATKFLKHLDKELLIKTKVRGGGELVVLDCNWKSEAVTGFVPYKLPKPDTASQASGTGAANSNASTADGEGEQKPKIRIAKLVYLPGPKLSPFFEEIGADKTTPQTASSLRALLQSHLSANKTPRIPPSASPLLFSTLSITSSVTREALFTAFLSLCQPYHTFPASSNPTKLHKGPPPKLTITLERRQGNKYVTRVSGVEELGIDAKMLAEKLSHKCAGAATVKQAVGKKAGVVEVQVQGRWDAVVRGLVEGWGVEKGAVEVVDKSGGKKK